ncbi:DNA-binding protein [Uliginosibacterium sp. sgz301328]|uniref:DNA-binding protein n=1 Tax=Uliginosibacterium sp. sgz301328 TaxID=3243764 RepID=UPI00359CF980
MAAGITEQDVWKAADALLIEGARPTIERVRQKIGRGSPNTVQPYLDTWFKGLGARIRDPQAFSAAADIPDPVVQVARYLWEAATAQAREQAEVALKAERAAIHQAQDELAQAQQALAQRECAMLAQVDTATSALGLAHAQIDECQRREARANAASVAAEKRVEELTGALDAARVQIDAIRVAADRERHEASESARLREQHWLGEVDKLRQELKAAGAKALAAEKQSSAREAENLASIHRLEAELRAHAQTLISHQDDAARREAENKSALQTAQAEVARLHGALAEARRPRAPTRSAARSAGPRPLQRGAGR